MSCTTWHNIKECCIKGKYWWKTLSKACSFSSSIYCHCSKWVLFIYTLNNVQLKSFVYECHTCITIIHCETVMGKMVFKANLHMHKSKISCMETKLSLLSFLLKMKKEVRIYRRICSQSLESLVLWEGQWCWW